MLEFDELRIRVRQIGPGRFLGLANGPAHAAEVLTVSDEPARLRARFNDLIDIELGRAPRSGVNVAAQLREIGRDVFGLLLCGELDACLTAAPRQTRRGSRASPPRGLRLRFDLPPELHDLPVETLSAPAKRPEQTIAFNSGRSLVRSIPGSPLQSRLPAFDDEPETIHLLVAVATPDIPGLPRIDPDRELTALSDIPGLEVETTVVRHATRRLVETWLDDHADQPSAILLIAHGGYDKTTEEGVVFLEDDGGAASRVPGNLLGGILVRARRLRLVVLNLCASASNARLEPFTGVAQSLIGQGVPAVIGMHGAVTDRAAESFGPLVLDGICAGKTVDEAVTAARQHLYSVPGHTSIEWATPALFLHEECGHGWLFKSREVRTDQADRDPLREGQHALDRVNGRGAVNPAVLLTAARYLRARRDWEQLLRIARTRKPSEEEEALATEARLELAWPRVEKLCAMLTDSAVEDAAIILKDIADQLPGQLADLLRTEIASTRVAHAHADAESALRGGLWSQAKEGFATLLREHPGYRDAEAGERYADGRIAETTGNWAEAIEAYLACEAFKDSTSRLRHARGQFAAASSDWSQAQEMFAALPAVDGWNVDGLLAWVRDGLYRQGLAAEESLDWNRAAGCYRELPPDYRDSQNRAAYADGRLAETDGRWDDAHALYAALGTSPPDAADRTRYVVGREAAAAAHWEAVIGEFGVLPDSYADGTVGLFRRLARARLAEGRGEWREALSHLQAIPDTELDGQVTLTRQHAYGRLAELAGDWMAAATAYASAADADLAICERYRYALGRACEREADWQGALSHYDAVPARHADTAARRGYVSARLAETAVEPDWRALTDGYRALPENFEDAGTRAEHARLRLAIEEEDWDSAVDAIGLLGDFPGTAPMSDYVRGRAAEQRRDWLLAAEHLERTTYADAPARLAYVRGRDLEASGRWQAAVDAYASAAPVADAADRRARLSVLLSELPWAEGVARAPLVTDPLAEHDPAFPYLALRSAQITPASSTDGVNAASYTLMERGGMTWQERAAWNELRIPAKRLVLDALLYRLRAPQALTALLAATDTIEQSAPQTLLNAELGDDAPLIMLLTGDRTAAVEAWRNRLRTVPTDMITVHCLAVAAYWHARELEDIGAWEQAEPAWRESLACWAVLLTDDEYWVGWRKARAACYSHAVTPADSARLRMELGQHLAGLLSRCGCRHADAGRPEQAARYQELIYFLEAELDGARALGEAGGLPVHGGQDLRTACGPAYLRIVGLADSLAGFVLTAEQKQAADPDHDGETLRRLRWAFSEISGTFSHTEHHRFELALRALGDLHLRRMADLPPDCTGPATHEAGDAARCTSCASFLLHNPAYAQLPRRAQRLVQDAVSIAVRAHLCVARDLLPVQPGAAMAALTEAISVSANAAMAVRTKQAVLRMVIGRAEALTDSAAPGVDRLNEAIALVQQALPLVGALGLSALNAKLAELFVERGVWYRLGCRDVGAKPDIDNSLADLRNALTLNPESARARVHLARALIFGADHPATSISGLLPPLRILGDGLRRAPANNRLGEGWRLALDRLESLLLADLDMKKLAELMLDLGEPDINPMNSSTRARYLFAQAQRRGDAGDSLGFLHGLVRASRANPVDETIRDTLLAAVEANPPRGDDQPEGGT